MLQAGDVFEFYIGTAKKIFEQAPLCVKLRISWQEMTDVKH